MSRFPSSVVLALLLAGVAAAAPAGAPAADGRARLGGEDESSESWDLAASFASGHGVFVRFSISNEGPGDRTGYALGQIVFPDGRVVPFQNGRLEGSWSLSDDRLRMEIGSSVLDLHAPTRHFEVDKSKKGVKVFLDFGPATAARPWRGAPRGLHLELLDLGAAVRGSIWVRDVMGEDAPPVPVEGRLTLTHTWMDDSEPDLARRRVESYGLTPQAGSPLFYRVEVLPAKGDPSSWLVARRPDGSWLESAGTGSAWQGEHAGTSGKYPLPASLTVADGGAKGRVVLGAEVLEHDPLDAAPGPFRWLLSFRMQPRQLWLESSAEIDWEQEPPLRIDARGFTSFYYMNPMD